MPINLKMDPERLQIQLAKIVEGNNANLRRCFKNLKIAADEAARRLKEAVNGGGEN